MNDFCDGVILVGVLGAILGMLIACAVFMPTCTPNSIWHKEAVELGYAHYDVNDEFQWVTNK